MMQLVAEQGKVSYAGRMPVSVSPATFPFIADMGEAARQRLERSVRRHSCSGTEQLIARGDEVAGAYLVERGALRVYYMHDDGREGTLYWVEAGQSCILALNCTFSRLAYPAWVESDGPTEISVIPGSMYRELFEIEPAVREFTFSTLSERLFELMGLVEETASRGLEARVAAFLLRRAKDGQRVDVTQEQLARHLSTSREVVTRVLRNLSRRNMIASGQGQISLLDCNGLRVLTE